MSEFQVLRNFENGLEPSQVLLMLCWDWSCEKMVGLQVRTLAGHSDSVLSVYFSADGKRIVSGSADNLVKIWDAASGAEVISSLWVCAEGVK